MELLKECFDEFNTAFTKSLIAVEFSDDQASRFLTEAVTAILATVQKTSVFQTIYCLLYAHSYQFPGEIDVDSIVKNSDINSDQLTVGFQAIAKVLLIVYTQKSSSKVAVVSC